jgi:hypothetical protein
MVASVSASAPTVTPKPVPLVPPAESRIPGTVHPHACGDTSLVTLRQTHKQVMVARASAADQPGLLALLWSGKESALKALRAGLRLDTRCVIVTPVDALRRLDDDKEGCVQEECANDPAFAVRQLHAVKGWHPRRQFHQLKHFVNIDIDATQHNLGSFFVSSSS